MSPSDPFEALGVEPAFNLDLALLEQRHRDLSRALHPDRHASSGAAERRMALGRAIEVNEAFRKLKDPIRRAEALLALRGVQSGEGKDPPAPPASRSARSACVRPARSARFSISARCESPSRYLCVAE